MVQVMQEEGVIRQQKEQHHLTEKSFEYIVNALVEEGL
jgi:hypothetical protein